LYKDLAIPQSINSTHTCTVHTCAAASFAVCRICHYIGSDIACRLFLAHNV